MTTDEPDLERVRKLIRAFTTRAREELDQRLKRWTLDFAKRDVHEVVGALLARQVTLASQLAKCPQIWNGHIAPLVLRSMADVYINLAWVLKDPADRCRKFIHYGLGQEKLQLEHRKAEMATREPIEAERVEAWINAQRLTFLIDVNLGSWSGLSNRAMAEEAGCIDFYNYVYSPFSGCVHSMWQHIGKYNLAECREPLHHPHSLPAVRAVPLDPEYLYLAAKYLQNVFAAFDDVFAIAIDGESAFDVLCRGLDEIGAAAWAASPRPDEPYGQPEHDQPA
jgi:hypothetical protein